MISTSLKGDAALLLLASKLSEAGIVTLFPVSDSLRFDLAIYVGRDFHRIQVKRAQRYKDTQRFEIPFRKISPRSSGPLVHRYSPEDVDFLVGVVMETGDFYCFPLSDVTHVKAAIQVDPHGVSTRVSHNRALDPELFRNTLRLKSGSVVKIGK